MQWRKSVWLDLDCDLMDTKKHQCLRITLTTLRRDTTYLFYTSSWSHHSHICTVPVGSPQPCQTGVYKAVCLYPSVCPESKRQNTKLLPSYQNGKTRVPDTKSMVIYPKGFTGLFVLIIKDHRRDGKMSLKFQGSLNGCKCHVHICLKISVENGAKNFTKLDLFPSKHLVMLTKPAHLWLFFVSSNKK